MNQIDLSSKNLIDLLREIRLFNKKDQFYDERSHKYKQVQDYIILIKSAFDLLSTKKPIVLLDCGCGKSYLSFLLYEHVKNNLNRPIKIIGIDNNLELINKCKKLAKNMNFKNMEFFHSDVEAFKTEEDVDIVYSLHACNTATDQTIAKGIFLKARYIFSVSCCQYTNKKNLTSHPLASISRHAPYKERLTDMIGDSMRVLLLEHFGYGVKIFEFTPAANTPKNIMIRAIYNVVKKENRKNALSNFEKLVKMFNFTPALKNLLFK